MYGSNFSFDILARLADMKIIHAIEKVHSHLEVSSFSFSSHLPEFEVVLEVVGYVNGRFQGCRFMSLDVANQHGLLCSNWIIHKQPSMIACHPKSAVAESKLRPVFNYIRVIN